jgi:hypothetical protein
MYVSVLDKCRFMWGPSDGMDPIEPAPRGREACDRPEHRDDPAGPGKQRVEGASGTARDTRRASPTRLGGPLVAVLGLSGLDRNMAAPQIRRIGRSLRSLVIPVLVFVVCVQAFEILLIKHV